MTSSEPTSPTLDQILRDAIEPVATRVAQAAQERGFDASGWEVVLRDADEVVWTASFAELLPRRDRSDV
jgi:hypothetical protein